MTTDTVKRTVEEIAEACQVEGLEADATFIHSIQGDIRDYLSQYRPNGEMQWDVVDYMGIPRDFIGMLQAVADYEVRL
jgi:hypothetical protein